MGCGKDKGHASWFLWRLRYDLLATVVLRELVTSVTERENVEQGDVTEMMDTAWGGRRYY